MHENETAMSMRGGRLAHASRANMRRVSAGRAGARDRALADGEDAAHGHHQKRRSQEVRCRESYSIHQVESRGRPDDLGEGLRQRVNADAAGKLRRRQVPDTSDIARGPLHPMPTPWKSRMAMSTPSESTNP